MDTKSLNKAVEEFYLVAMEYCRLVENTYENDKFNFLMKSRKILALVYLKASLFPDVEIDFIDEPERFVNEKDWNIIRDNISEILGKSDSYIDILSIESVNPESFENELLSDCFADIYQDLKNFVSNFEMGNEEAIDAAFADCIESYEKYWGPKLLAVLANIHLLKLNYDEENEKNEEIELTPTKSKILNQRFNP
ncbi:MAG: DUF5063 domain-containing protein [Bacteroidales bacterium]